MSKKVLLIDIPNLFYRAFFAVPRTLKTPDGIFSNAVFGTASTLLSLFENEKPDFIFGFRDEKEKTFRHEQDANYKAQRPSMPDELSVQMPFIKLLFESLNIPVYSLSGYEADDCIATSAVQFAQKGAEVYIVSADQDLFGLVRENIFVLKPENGGKLIKMNREKVQEKLGVYPEQVADYKAIAGDSSDNLPGIPGIGAKGAAQMLNQFGTLENLLINASAVEGKRGDLLRANRELAISTKQMTELHLNVPLNFEMDKGSVDSINWQNGRDFFAKMGFRLLLARLSRMNLGFIRSDIDDNGSQELFSFANKKIDKVNMNKSQQLGLF